MAQKDLTTKKLESHTEVFATIFNALLFEDNLLQSQNLSMLPTEEFTIILNFSKKPWTTNKSLVDMVRKTDSKFIKWMKNYSIYVYDMCNLSYAQIDRLEGDFKEIAKIFTYGNKVAGIRINGLKYPLDTLDFLIAYRNEESYISARKRIADMEKKGDVITMGTLVDELERSKTIEIAKKFLENGGSEEVVIKTLADGLNITEEEANEVFINEVK